MFANFLVLLVLLSFIVDEQILFIRIGLAKTKKKIEKK